jgi:pimeloyl-ACP methyl ester carboxylesterase
MKTSVVFVHGLFLNGAEFGLMRRRLTAERGFDSRRFSYPTVRGSLEKTLDLLEQFVRKLDAERIHFVGHSLGGIVLSRFFERASDPRIGRVVMLGTPLGGSRSAQGVARHAFLRRIVGPLVARELVDPCEPRRWNCSHDLGLIAGTRPMGLGQFFAKFDEDCDGTVGVSETKLPGQSAHIALPVSHMGLLLSADVAHEVGEFLANGSFVGGR